MKIYADKKSKEFEIIKETTTQSILSDLFTCVGFIVIFGCGIAFEMYVGRSSIVEFGMIFLMFLFLFVSEERTKREKLTKGELIKMIEEL
jgi:hypothetical protein